MDTYQMGKAHQSHSKNSIEFQMYDFQDFPVVCADKYGFITNKFIAGELMKSGKPRPKNAISFIMECEPSRSFNDCIRHFVLDFIQREFSPMFVDSIGCSQAFVRIRLQTYRDQEVEDFTISTELMKVLLNRGIYLDFWFLRSR